MGLRLFTNVRSSIKRIWQAVAARFHFRNVNPSIDRLNHFHRHGARTLKSILLPDLHALRNLLNKITNRKQFIRGVKITLLLLICLWIINLGILAGSLFNHVKRLQEMLKDPAQLNLTSVASEVHGARLEFSIVHAELAPVLWISGLFGGDLGAVQPLMEAGNDSLKAADEVLSALAPSMGNLKLSTFSMKQVPQILDGLTKARPALAGAETHVDAAGMALRRVKGPLSPRLEGWVKKANTLVQFAQFGLGGAKIMPDLMGQAGTRNYLILLENSEELRPTGGFISAIGHIQVSHGQLISMTTEDSYAVDDFSKVYPDPPQPLLDYMSSEQWVLRDANWSPDFPTTALDAIQLYQVSRPEQLQGVFGLTLKGVELLFSGLGSLDVQGWSEPITSNNISRIFKNLGIHPRIFPTTGRS